MDENKGCKIIDIQGLTSRILTRYIDTDFPQLNLSNSLTNKMFEAEIEKYEQSIYRDAVAHALTRQNVSTFMANGFRNALQYLPKKIIFRYISENKYLAEAYNGIMNEIFRNVGTEPQFQRITDNYTSKIDLVYDIYQNIEIAKYIFTHFFYIPVDQGVIPIVFFKRHPTLEPKYNEFLQTLLKKDAVEHLLKVKDQYLSRIIDAEFQHQNNLWAIASIESRISRNARIDLYIKYEILVDYQQSEIDKLHNLLVMPDIEQIYIDYPQFNAVYDMYKSGKITISDNCRGKIDMLEQFKRADMIPYNNTSPPIVEDFDEHIFNITEDKQHANPNFRFLYLQQKYNLPIDGINYGSIGNYAISELYRHFLKFVRFTPNFFENEYGTVLGTFKNDKDMFIKNGLAITAIQVVNDNLKTVGSLPLNKCVVLRSPNKFLGSIDDMSRFGENFVGNYISFLAKLTELPMVERPYIINWITRVRTSLVSLESAPKLANLVIPDKKGLSETVAKALILAFIYNLGDDPMNFEMRIDNPF